MAKYAKISALSFAPVPNDGLPFECERYKAAVISNLTHYTKKVAHENPDLIIFPEASNRPAGLSLDERWRFFREANGDIEKAVSALAKKYNTNIAFACIRVEKEPEDEEYPYRNSIIYYNRQGEVVGIYDKCFLVPSEHTVVKIGFGKIPDSLIELDFGRVATAICFDMHDVELLRRYEQLDPDLIVFSSNFKAIVWADVWAATCGAYFAASLGNKLRESGRIIDPFGKTVASTVNGKNDATARVNLDFRVVHEDDNHDWRTHKFTDAQKKYGDGFNFVSSQGGGMSIIQSDIDGVGIDEIIDEFGIIRAEDYFGEALALRREFYKNK